jgi:hypothetical protein
MISRSGSDKQKLVDICFECVLTVLDPEYVESFTKMTQAERAEWVSKQLRACGFNTEPVGCSWGVLTQPKALTKLDERRLRDADVALALPEPRTKEEAIEQLGLIHDGIAALQSLDDLGSIEANSAAMDKCIALQKKYDRLKARLEQMGGR